MWICFDWGIPQLSPFVIIRAGTCDNYLLIGNFLILILSFSIITNPPFSKALLNKSHLSVSNLKNRNALTFWILNIMTDGAPEAEKVNSFPKSKS